MATKITIDLKKLASLFARSAATKELPTPIRRFAAQLTILTVHVRRVEEKLDEEAAARTAADAALDERLGEAIELLMAASAKGGAPAEPPAEAPAEPAEGAETAAEGESSEDEDAEEMAARVLRETEEEARAIEKKPPASVVPLKKPAKPPASTALATVPKDGAAPDGAAS